MNEIREPDFMQSCEDTDHLTFTARQTVRDSVINLKPLRHAGSTDMSFFSSFTLFYPGLPPSMQLHQARSFCDRLRESLSLHDSLLAVKLKYGSAIDQDAETTNLMEWNETGLMGRTVKYPWDHEQQNLPWAELWPDPAFDSRNLYRAYIGLGGLPKSVSTELLAMRDAQTTHEYIAPDSLSFQIDPVCPAILRTEELICCGYIELSFAGNGYFTWQPLSRYWEQVRTAPTLRQVMEMCRRTFPVPRLDNLNELTSCLGELFLNRDEYQEGDWVVSVSESG